MNFELHEKLKLCWHPKESFKKLGEKYDVDVSFYIEDKVLYLIFKGSSSPIDWKMNFSFWYKPYKHMDKLMLVHYGFHKTYKVIRDVIHEIFKISEIEKVVIRGFSLGAAMATFCNEDFVWHKENKSGYSHIEIDAIVAGSPRVCSLFGWKEFNRRNKNLLRVENHNDIVTHVPFSIMLYKHVGNLYRIGERNILDKILPFEEKDIYVHNRSSYLGYLLNDNYKDTIENNYLYKIIYKKYNLFIISFMILGLVLGILLV